MIPALLAGWHGLGPETKGAIIQAVATLLAAGVGVVAILNQIRSQAKQNRESIAENEKRKIKAQMFAGTTQRVQRSEEHTSELQSLMRISYAVFCLIKKTVKEILTYTLQAVTSNIP